MDADTEHLLQGSLKSMFAGSPPDLAAALAELGWSEVLAEVDVDSAQALLAREHGRALSGTPMLDGVAAAALGLPPSTRFIWPHFADGSAIAASPVSGGSEYTGLVLGEVPADALLPIAGRLYPCDSAALAIEPLGGIDPAAGWHVVRGVLPEGAAAGDGPDAAGKTDRGKADRDKADWVDAERAATQALAHEIIVLGECALDIATGHVRQRFQFGQAIGSYQSVRHRLAGAYASLVGARALTRAAALDGGLDAARLAKAAAGRAHDEIARECIQVCGGIGLSAEFPLAGYVKRGFLLDVFLNSRAAVVRQFGQSLLAGAGPAPIAQF